ncbi:hypothetical protein IV73_GL000147 [Weissella kandleri]|uniref:Uncharacterized protein n=1 Tax=Weissella kandleri TaxID=1616 RepID=A0A0R2JMI8_9LACO|nr:hypothetical protein [Weissella kandleri]KRN75655.1 hypothetical protein IV73_GL000147 [Weissella kandleri]
MKGKRAKYVVYDRDELLVTLGDVFDVSDFLELTVASVYSAVTRKSVTQSGYTVERL